MINQGEHYLHGHAALALFLSVALGYLLGRVPFGDIQIGGICGTVIVALILGQSGAGVPPGAAGLSFSLFVYSLGYLGGPSFLSSLNRRTLALLIFPVLQFVLALAMTLAAAWTLRLTVPTAVGLLTGASSQSAALGAATEGLPAADVDALTTSFAVAYLVSILTTVIFVSQILPKFLQIRSGDHDATDYSPVLPPDVIGRAFVVADKIELRLEDLRERLGRRVVVADVLRRSTTSAPNTVSDGDVVRVIGARKVLATAGAEIGPEIPMPAELMVSTQTVDVVVARPIPRPCTLGNVRASAVVVLGIRRLNQSLPLHDEVELRDGDVISLAGGAAEVQREAKRLGTIRDIRATTDFAFLGAGLAIGIAIGLASIHVGGASISLGTSAAVLLTGLFIGWLNSRRHSLGQYDPAAAEVVKDLGLAIFIGCTALSAAPGALEFFRRYGFVVPGTSALIVLVAAVVSLLICRRLMRMPPLRVLGVLAGQQSSSPTMSALQKRFPSSEPLLSYVPIYATSTILGPVLMPAVIRLMSLVTR